MGAPSRAPIVRLHLTDSEAYWCRVTEMGLLIRERSIHCSAGL